MPVSTWRAEPVGDSERRGAAGHQAVEDIDDGVGKDRTEAQALFRQGYEERAAAGLGKGAAGGLEADAVSVGLDHGGGFAGDALGKRAPVSRQSREVDGQAAAGKRWGRGWNVVGHWPERKAPSAGMDSGVRRNDGRWLAGSGE